MFLLLEDANCRVVEFSPKHKLPEIFVYDAGPDRGPGSWLVFSGRHQWCERGFGEREAQLDVNGERMISFRSAEFWRLHLVP